MGWHCSRSSWGAGLFTTGSLAFSLPPGYGNDLHPHRPKTSTPTQQSESSLPHIQTSES